MNLIATRLAAVHARIGLACEFAGRHPGDLKLIAVSKQQPADAIRGAVAAGQREFGENYLQEALDKIGVLQDLDLVWHFIGPVQANKTRRIAESFDWVHSLDRLKVAERLSEQRPPERPALQVCVQVNISGEASKHGVAPAAAEALCRAVLRLPRLQLRGLMALPAPEADESRQRDGLAALAHLYHELQARGLPLDTLSMGTSTDLEAAVAEGATLLRIGTDIFGPRPFTSEEPA